ncbi:MAG: alpha-amylase family glycosyl hydrolase, partial [Bryobacteraceae bacterium]
MHTPNATYRLQLNKDFGFCDVLKLVPHLDSIGISDLYLSPIFQARKGSMHGYDVTDPSRLNEELGTPQDFDALVEGLRGRGMSILLDIVPNHMAASAENPWWVDVLENGSASQYSAFFDVEWNDDSPAVHEGIYLPILGEPYAEALEQQKLHLWIDEQGLHLSYYDTPFPLDPSTYGDVVSYRLSDLLGKLDPATPLLRELGEFLESTERLPARSSSEWEILELRRREAPRVKRKLADLYARFQQVRSFIDENIRIFNGKKGDPRSFDLLDALIRKQPYELAFWRVAREKINYRRFFDVTELIGIRAQEAQVFDATHALPLELLAEGKVSGLRIDHVDGLLDPAGYLGRLQKRATEAAGGKTVYIIVEKILNDRELLPDGWPVAGTTGYDFLGAVNNLFVHPEGLERLQQFYAEFTGETRSFYDVANEQKRKIMRDLFVGEMNALAFHLQSIAENDRYGRD